MMMMMMEGSGRGLYLRYCPSICLEELRKTTKHLSRESLSPGRDLNPAPSEKEAGALSTRQPHSVFFPDEQP
jgi:hypothetical protein